LEVEGKLFITTIGDDITLYDFNINAESIIGARNKGNEPGCQPMPERMILVSRITRGSS
jgi:hypothetical protein